MKKKGMTMKKPVSRKMFGNKWPFTVESGYVYSVNQAAIFETATVKYQINGLAEIAGYTPIDPIWRDDLNIPIGPGDTPAKINIGPMIELALENELENDS